MPYEPTIIIKVEDLDKQENLFYDILGYLPDEDTRGGEEGKTVLESIRDLYFEDKKHIVDIFGIKCRHFTPCFSTYNLEIRNKLDELGIPYSLI